MAKSLGGLELYFEKCCLWFFNSPHHTVNIALKDSRLEKRLKIAQVPVLTLTSASNWMSVFNAYKLASIIENHNIDVVHVHHKDDLLLMALTTLMSKKKFILVHSRQMQIPHSKKDIWHKFIYRKIDLFITITEQLRKDAINRIPLDESKIKTLYYGVKAPQNFSKENCVTVFNKNIQDKKFNIGVFSRIEYLKGQHLVVEAANYLQQQYPILNYYFIGDIMDKDYNQELLISIKKYNLSNIICFKGFHPNPIEIMPCFDLILLPSYNETFGLVLAEAMRSGVPVIGTNYGGVTEIISHKKTGLLFEKDNYKDLALQIEVLLNDENLRKDLARNGKEKGDNAFNEELHFKKLEELMKFKLN